MVIQILTVILQVTRSPEGAAAVTQAYEFAIVRKI